MCMRSNQFSMHSLRSDHHLGSIPTRLYRAGCQWYHCPTPQYVFFPGQYDRAGWCSSRGETINNAGNGRVGFVVKPKRSRGAPVVEAPVVEGLLILVKMHLVGSLMEHSSENSWPIQNPRRINVTSNLGMATDIPAKHYYGGNKAPCDSQFGGVLFGRNTQTICIPANPSTFSEGTWTLLAPTPVPPSEKALGSLGYIHTRIQPQRGDPFGPTTTSRCC